MIRHRHLTLLAAPLLLSSAAVAFASPAPAAPRPAASCELVASGEGGGGPYTLVLEGFEPNQSVTINGPHTSRRTRVGDEGTLDQQGVGYGKYSVTSKGKRTGCLTPPGGKHDGGGKQGKVQVTKVEVVTLTAQGTVVDCTKPSKVLFDGKITGTGVGEVPYFWTFASSPDVLSRGKAVFTPGTTGASVLLATEFVSVNGNPPNAFVTLHVPSANMNAQSATLTLTCAKP
ncbi:hypothetical protein ACIPW5_10910 [Streptomyces sp. NPDC090077]|uniref:hypothetical protein n=1 Tax=Streptomyces sp. NPDC090077 TaxID=3365938 RepID=UPI0037FC3414